MEGGRFSCQNLEVSQLRRFDQRKGLRERPTFAFKMGLSIKAVGFRSGDTQKVRRKDRQDEQRQDRCGCEAAEDDYRHWPLDGVAGGAGSQCEREEAEGGYTGGDQDCRKPVGSSLTCDLC